MSNELIMAAELIKEECSKHKDCTGCFYGCVDGGGVTNCIINGCGDCPVGWNLSELEKKEC